MRSLVLRLFQSGSIAFSVGEYGGMKTNSMPSQYYVEILEVIKMHLEG